MSALPTFLGLGVVKAGTTLLHTWLAEHPEVCVPRDRKEVNFFNRYYDRGLGWYSSLFDPSPATRAIGEYSVSYLHSPEAVSRIAHDLPETRCIVSLRDPVARLESQYRHYAAVAGYQGSCADFMREHPNACVGSRYAWQLEHLFAHIPCERVYVTTLEDASHDPVPVARALYEFVGVDATYVPHSLHARVNPTGQPRSPALSRARGALSRFATEHDLRWMLRTGRALRLGRLWTRPGSTTDVRPALDRDGARFVRECFLDDIEATGRLLGRDLASMWRRGAEDEEG